MQVRTVDGVVVPNIFMPPLYPFFLYIIKIITNDSNYFVQIVLFLQVLFSLYYIFIFYKLTSKFFSAKLSYLISLVFSLLPIHIYATSQISSASIHLGFLIIYFYYFLNFVDSETSSVRFVGLGRDRFVGTVVGQGLFEFGDVDGRASEVRLQHPMALEHSQNMLYVADSYNHKIKSYRQRSNYQ